MDRAGEGTLDIQHYKRRLLEEEQRLLALFERAKEEAREAVPDPIHDRTDESVLDEMKEERLEEAEAYGETLKQVRAALQRIEDGTYGRCLVDGEPIDEKRLEATPWAAYCRRHQEERERSSSLKTPSL
jgi:DnaK suppressor protein